MAINFVRASSQLVSLGINVPTFQNTAGMSLLFWAIFRDPSVIEHVIAYNSGGGGGTGNSRMEVEAGTTGANTLQSDVNAVDGALESAYEVAGALAAYIGKVVHVGITCDLPTNTARIYLNGVLIGSGAYAGPVGAAVTPNTPSDRVVYGSSDHVVPANYFDGVLDDVRAYPRALSDAEVATVYGCEGVDGIVLSLQDRFCMDEQVPSTVVGNAVSCGPRQGGGVGVNSPTFLESLRPTYRRRLA